MPKISVVIPTFNRSKLLPDLIAGLSEQSLDRVEFEVIVVDNGSTDNTFALLTDLIPTLAINLRVVSNPDCDRGPAPARNLGVQVSHGDIIAFTDSDCRPAPDWLARGVAAFRDENVAMATGPVDFKPEQRSRLSLFARKTMVCDREHPTYPTANAFYRRSVFQQHSGFNTELSFPDILGQTVEAADTDLAWRIKEAGERNLFIKDAIVYHEVEVMGTWWWLIEPTRLFLVPALVKSHPGLREALLSHGFFFYRRSIFYYLLIILIVILLVAAPTMIVLFFPLLVIAAMFKADAFKLKAIAYSGLSILLNTIKIYVMCASLICGSIRYRSLVL